MAMFVRVRYVAMAIDTRTVRIRVGRTRNQTTPAQRQSAENAAIDGGAEDSKCSAMRLGVEQCKHERGCDGGSARGQVDTEVARDKELGPLELFGIAEEGEDGVVVTSKIGEVEQLIVGPYGLAESDVLLQDSVRKLFVCRWIGVC